MLPLRDTIPSEKVPFVNYFFIGVNTLFFFYELFLPMPALKVFITQYGFVPARFFGALIHIPDIGFGPFLAESLTLLTSMFLHGGWMHFLGNMLFLYIFGDNVEDRLGHVRYFFWYILWGIAASLAQGLFSITGVVTMIGASGAISGVMGAYMRFFPHSRVLTLIPFFLFFEIIEIPAFIYLAFWFILQFFQGAFSLMARSNGGIAFWAHVGGFVVGFFMATWFDNRRKRKQRVILVEDSEWPFDF